MTQVKPKWIGSFYGSDFSHQDYEILTIQNIAGKVLKPELALMNSKWFDYRRLHPMLATFYFMECYKTAYRGFYRVAVNADIADFVKPIKGDNFLEAREKLSFWKLRQLIDGLGIRYDFFLSHAMRWYAEECFRRESLYPPRPGHIATNEDLITSVMIAWEEEIAMRIQVAQDDWFRIENFVGVKDQLEYEQFSIAQIRNRQVKRFSLCSALYINDSVRITEAIKEFGESLVLDAIKEIRIPEEISQQ
jgi:hypothetical protein